MGACLHAILSVSIACKHAPTRTAPSYFRYCLAANAGARYALVPRVCFTSNLRRHVDCPEQTVDARNVAEALEAVFAQRPKLRGYILDDQGSLHRHMVILVNGVAIRDRERLQLPVEADDEIYIVQALSGG